MSETDETLACVPFFGTSSGSLRYISNVKRVKHSKSRRNAAKPHLIRCSLDVLEQLVVLSAAQRLAREQDVCAGGLAVPAELCRGVGRVQGDLVHVFKTGLGATSMNLVNQASKMCSKQRGHL
jgi:hypothetical protein